MAKLVDAKPERIILMDENGRWRQVLPSQLILFDAEWAKRKQAGLIPVPGAVQLAGAETPATPPEAAAEVPVPLEESPAKAAPVPAANLTPRSRPDTLGGTPAGR